MEDFPGWKSERDPYLLQSKTMNIRKSVQRWGWCMAPPCSSSLSSSHYENVKIGHLKSLKLNISPWLSACFLLYKNLFFDIPMHILSPSSYRRLFAWRTNSDWIRAFYILKFAIGATVLVIMQIYWDVSLISLFLYFFISLFLYFFISLFLYFFLYSKLFSHHTGLC